MIRSLPAGCLTWRLKPVILATWEAEVKRFQIQDLLEVLSEFKASPGDVTRSCPQPKKICWSAAGQVVAHTFSLSTIEAEAGEREAV